MKDFNGILKKGERGKVKRQRRKGERGVRDRVWVCLCISVHSVRLCLCRVLGVIELDASVKHHAVLIALKSTRVQEYIPASGLGLDATTLN
jgi:hypothetical protein